MEGWKRPHLVPHPDSIDKHWPFELSLAESEVPDDSERGEECVALGRGYVIYGLHSEA